MEHRSINSFSVPEYIPIYKTLDELCDEIYHMYMLTVYKKESEDIDDLVRRDNMMNLLLQPEFIDIICRKFNEKTITLKTVNSLMHHLDPSRHSFFYSNVSEHEDYKLIHESFSRLLFSVNQFVASIHDKYYSNYIITPDNLLIDFPHWQCDHPELEDNTAFKALESFQPPLL